MAHSSTYSPLLLTSYSERGKNILRFQRIIKHTLVRFALFTVATLGSTVFSVSSAEVVVVVSTRSTISSLTTSQIAKIFLAKTGTFPGGGNAVPLDQAEGTAIRNEFYAKVTGKDTAQLKAYWSKIIFAGDGQPPKVTLGNEGVKKALANDPSAIGYIDKSAVDNSIRVVLTP